MDVDGGLGVFRSVFRRRLRFFVFVFFSWKRFLGFCLFVSVGVWGVGLGFEFFLGF